MSSVFSFLPRFFMLSQANLITMKHLQTIEILHRHLEHTSTSGQLDTPRYIASVDRATLVRLSSKACSFFLARAASCVFYIETQPPSSAILGILIWMQQQHPITHPSPLLCPEILGDAV